MTADSVLSRNMSIFASQVDDELVMMDESQGLYFGLNPVGRKIWELLDEPRSYQALVTSLTKVYDAAEEQCERDVRPFLLKMIEHKLVSVA